MPNDELLVTQEVRLHLENLLDELGVTNPAINITEGSIRGDNFLGIIAKANCRGKCAKTGEELCYNFIIKSAPRQGIIRSIGPLREAYEREIFVYSEVFRHFEVLQEEGNVKNKFESHAKLYKSSMEAFNEALIMEDMKSLDYKLKKKNEPLDYDHVLLVLREYGKLHALSYAMRQQKPKMFEELTRNLGERLVYFWRDDKEVSDSVTSQIANVLNAFDPVKDEVVYNKLKEFTANCLESLGELLEPDSAGRYAVIGHGDCWINNLLFKYDDSEDSPPTQVCYLDWQLSRIGSPALDLSYFIFTCTDKKLRDEHYDHLLKEYHRSLSDFLVELGCDPEALFPFEALQEQLKRFSSYGLYFSIMVVLLMLSDWDELPDIHDVKYEDRTEKLKFETKNMDEYNARIRDVVMDFVRFDYDFLYVRENH